MLEPCVTLQHDDENEHILASENAQLKAEEIQKVIHLY